VPAARNRSTTALWQDEYQAEVVFRDLPYLSENRHGLKEIKMDDRDDIIHEATGFLLRFLLELL
jgi:hypothetical protein